MVLDLEEKSGISKKDHNKYCGGGGGDGYYGGGAGDWGDKGNDGGGGGGSSFCNAENCTESEINYEFDYSNIRIYRYVDIEE